MKMARALWIVPMSLAAAAVKGSKTKIQWPWLFCLAALANSYLFPGVPIYKFLSRAGK